MNKIGTFAYHSILLFSFLGTLFIPFSFRYWNVQSSITKFLFEDLIHYISVRFECIPLTNPEITSDSGSLYILLIILFIASPILTVTLSFFNFWKNNHTTILLFIQLFLTYYPSIVLLKYGFDKLFKAQFYLPEPNTLYTPLGMLDKDILYWSTMGTSHTYTVFSGCLELICALFLLYNRTRVLGLFLLFGVLIHVVFINIGFDISVKLYSLFLLFVCCLLMAPFIKKVVHFFVLNHSVKLTDVTLNRTVSAWKARVIVKALAIILFFAESLFPFIQNGQYNDDTVPRNYLHGAYQITRINKTKVNGLDLKIKRVFIHRHNYFIVQYEDDSMEDFYLDINRQKKQFELTNYDGEVKKMYYTYSDSNKTLELKSTELGITMYCKSLPWKDLPLLKPLFHWTVDEIHE